MKTKILKNKRGFTLIEMLIYIFILILMLGVIMNITISVINSGKIVKALRNIENSTLTSFERISRELRQAESVNLSSSVLSVHPGHLVLVGTDDFGAPRTVEFRLSGNVLMLRENGIDVGALTEPNTRVTELIFRRFVNSNSEGIRTEITLESGTSTSYRSSKFYYSAIIR